MTFGEIHETVPLQKPIGRGSCAVKFRSQNVWEPLGQAVRTEQTEPNSNRRLLRTSNRRKTSFPPVAVRNHVSHINSTAGTLQAECGTRPHQDLVRRIEVAPHVTTILMVASQCAAKSQACPLGKTSTPWAISQAMWPHRLRNCPRCTGLAKWACLRFCSALGRHHQNCGHVWSDFDPPHQILVGSGSALSLKRSSSRIDVTDVVAYSNWRKGCLSAV